VEKMREINVNKIKQIVKRLSMEANYFLGNDVVDAFKKGLDIEESPVGKNVLNILLENAKISAKENVPICQDTGVAVIFLEIGQDIHFTGGDLYEAINNGVREGYKEGYLRKSMCNPFTRKNTGDNTPAVIHTSIVPGDKVKIIVAPKGGGSENMSLQQMLKPSDGLEGIKKMVINRASEAGPNPCPPVIIGVGIGGNFERSAILSKMSLLRELGTPNPDPELNDIEAELLEKINNLGMGPQGLGGRVYCLGVHILLEPCHIASLPVAINIQCHAARHKEIVL
jgi:fumarate hydratase subunit alpha